jgi:hypothetical protein
MQTLNGKKPFKTKLLNTKVKGTAPARVPAPDPETGFMVIPPATEDQTVMELINAAIKEMGGARGFVEWAKRNQDVFYEKIMPRAMPLQVVGADGGPITVQVIDPVSGGKIYEAKWTKEPYKIPQETTSGESNGKDADDTATRKLDTKTVSATAIPGVLAGGSKSEKRSSGMAKKSR